MEILAGDLMNVIVAIFSAFLLYHIRDLGETYQNGSSGAVLPLNLLSCYRCVIVFLSSHVIRCFSLGLDRHYLEPERDFTFIPATSAVGSEIYALFATCLILN